MSQTISSVVTTGPMVAVMVGLLACRGQHAPSASTPSPLPSDSVTDALSVVKELSFDEATALRDELNDGMIATMTRYLGDCGLMADRLEEYLASRQAEYEAVAATLRKVPWPAQELPPDKLKGRLEKAENTMRNLAPVSRACRVNTRVVAVLRTRYYMR